MRSVLVSSEGTLHKALAHRFHLFPVTLAAGVGRMPFRRYAVYSAVSGVIWASGVTLLGYALGNVQFVRTHIELMLVFIVLVSLIPMGVEALRARRRRDQLPGSTETPLP